MSRAPVTFGGRVPAPPSAGRERQKERPADLPAFLLSVLESSVLAHERTRRDRALWVVPTIAQTRRDDIHARVHIGQVGEPFEVLMSGEDSDIRLLREDVS